MQKLIWKQGKTWTAVEESDDTSEKKTDSDVEQEWQQILSEISKSEQSDKHSVNTDQSKVTGIRQLKQKRAKVAAEWISF